MSEVAKMYENAGIKPEYDYFTAIKYDFPKIFQCFHLNKEELVDKIIYCKKNILIKVLRVDKDYPDFTAEKQLELVKWCCKKCRRFYIYNINDIDNFAENLAKEFNHYWQDLTEQERTEIAEILRG